MKIEVKNASYTYNKGQTFEQEALKDISFNIAPGDFIGIIGHTGSGKSTLIQLLNALLEPSSGEVLVDNEDLFDKEKKVKIRQKIGLVFQYPEHQLFAETVYEDVAFGPTNLGLSESDIDKRVKESLDAVGLDESFYKESPFALSGGEKRRVAIAGVLALKPEVLILDEPTAGLDPVGRVEILEQVRHMHESLGQSIVFVSHSMEDIGEYAKRILVLDKGRLVRNGKPEEVFADIEYLESIGLKAPEVCYVIESLREAGYDMPKAGSIYKMEDALEFFSEWLSN